MRDDQQNSDLRHQAEVEQRSVHAIREYKTRVRRAVDQVITDEAAVLKRLGES
ncbi:MAG: hypothetical protein ACRDQU_15285 [Pseudonocardiaceae bacterium]